MDRETDWIGKQTAIHLSRCNVRWTSIASGECLSSPHVGDNVSIAETEVADGQDEADSNGEEPASPVEETHAVKAAKRKYSSSLEASAALEAEFGAFDAYRAAPLNQNRKGVAVAHSTRVSDRERVLRFMGWLVAMGKLNTHTLAIFASPQIGTAAERYVNVLVEEQSCKYSYAALMVGSFIAVARFAAGRRGPCGPDAGSIPKLCTLHEQCKQQARKQDKFDVANKPEAWLDWGDVQEVRRSAEVTLGEAKSDAAKFKLIRDITILRLLADQPPDRVGVTRTLILGSSLKVKKGGGYELDLNEGAHKTSSLFGPSRTTLNASITPWLDRYIKLALIPNGGHLFHPSGSPLEAIGISNWTHLVQSLFMRHGGVKLSPKDTRASFITFLRSGEHDDAAVKAASIAMRHSSKTQASNAYDKGSCDLRVSAAMKVAADFSDKFSSAASSSSTAN